MKTRMASRIMIGSDATPTGRLDGIVGDIPLIDLVGDLGYSCYLQRHVLQFCTDDPAATVAYLTELAEQAMRLAEQVQARTGPFQVVKP